MKCIAALLLLSPAVAVPGSSSWALEGLDEATSALEGMVGANWSANDTVAAADALMHCAVLPRLYKDTYEMKQCRDGSLMKAFGLSLGNGLMVGEQVINISDDRLEWLVEELSPYISRLLISEAHKQSVAFCSHSECAEAQRKLSSAVAPCYAGYICSLQQSTAGLTSFATCKAASQEMMNAVLVEQLPQQCGTEAGSAGSEVYCSEVLEKIVVSDFKCYVEMSAAQSCSEHCKQTFQALRSEFPTCTSLLMGTAAHMQHLVHEYMHKLHPELPPVPEKSYEKLCNETVATMELLV